MTARCIGSCAPLFILGVAFVVIGLATLLVGIFANLRLDGRFYGDFLIYTGSLIVFFSLMWWVLWYTANVAVRSGELDRSGGGKDSLKAALSNRIPTWPSSEKQGRDNAAFVPSLDTSTSTSTNVKTVELVIMKNSEMLLNTAMNGKSERLL